MLWEQVTPEPRSAEDTETQANAAPRSGSEALHQRLDPRRILKLAGALPAALGPLGYTRGSIRGGY